MESHEIRNQLNRNITVKDSSFLELSKLQQQVALIHKKNKQKFRLILKQQCDYHVDLYEPNQQLKAQKAFKKQLLLKQLDKLMDQESLLDKKLTQIKFQKQQENNKIQKTLSLELNSYQTLRNIWTKHEKNVAQSKNSMEYIQSLNFTVGVIKNTITGLKKKEQLSAISYQVQSLAYENQKYQRLLLKYEQSLMRNQELRHLINSLQTKLSEKTQCQVALNDQILLKQKQIKEQKKQKQILQVNHKFFVAQLKQQAYCIQNKLQALQKWKHNLEKNQYQNKLNHFKIFIESANHSHLSKNQQICSYSITKPLTDIVNFMTQHSDQNNQLLTLSNANSLSQLAQSQQNQQNNIQIRIPSLNLTSSSQNISIRRKMPTDRPLKVKSNQYSSTYLGNKFSNLKFSKITSNITLNDQSMKKFIRKNQKIGTSRNIQPQSSQRTSESSLLGETY